MVLGTAMQAAPLGRSLKLAGPEQPRSRRSPLALQAATTDAEFDK